MKLALPLLALILVCAMVGWAQGPAEASPSQPVSSPVAYVYVSNLANNTYQITGFSADATGRLTPISGSPFPSVVQYMALNGKWLFGTDGYTAQDQYVYVRSLSIGSNGALQEVSSINATNYNPSGRGGPWNVFLDHTGSTLYGGDLDYDDMGNTVYQSFTIDQKTGQLNFQALTNDPSVIRGAPLSFTGTNLYAYSSGSTNNGTQAIRGIFGYKRNANGSLTDLKINPPIPTPPKGVTYCPVGAAADPTNHLAVALVPMNSLCASQQGAAQLAVYTQDSSGRLTTTSTASNMPKTLTQGINSYWMAPSGKLLAVAGFGGLQVFHFNGANPITHYTGLLTTQSIDQVFWDNANHLYAISRQFGNLYVFTVTPTSYSQAPGSPYPIPGNQNLIVLPK